MRPLRLSIGKLMAFVVFLAVALASLARPTNLWASFVFAVLLSTLCLSLVGTAFAKGDRRVFWVGYLAFGGASFLLLFPLASLAVPSHPVALLTDYLIQVVHPPRPTGPNSSVMTLDGIGQRDFYNVSYGLSAIAVAYMGAVISRALFREAHP